jgi:iron complex transport system substrate-binding protein
VVDGPAYFNRPGPRVVDGAEILAGIVSGAGHPAATWVKAGR